MVKFALSTKGCLYTAFVRGEPLNSGLQNLASRNYKHPSILRCEAFFDTLNRLGVTGHTDRQTDRHSDSTGRVALHYIARQHYRSRIFETGAFKTYHCQMKLAENGFKIGVGLTVCLMFLGEVIVWTGMKSLEYEVDGTG